MAEEADRKAVSFAISDGRRGRGLAMGVTFVSEGRLHKIEKVVPQRPPMHFYACGENGSKTGTYETLSISIKF